MANMNRFCRNCGKEYLDNTLRYCASCGTPTGNQTNATGFAGGKEEQSFLMRVGTRFGPTGRQGRLAFVLNVLAIWGVIFAISFIVGFVYFWNNPYAPEDSVDGLAILLTIPGYVLTAFQMVKRLHDFGRSPWHLLCFFIPLWHLYEWFKVIFVSGDKAPNDYGPYP